MNILYLQDNVAKDALSRLSTGSTTHFEEDKRELAKYVHKYTLTLKSSTNEFHRRSSSDDE